VRPDDLKSSLRIAYVHQGYELYGSDRMALLSIKALRRHFPDAAINVRLPKEGPLSDSLGPGVRLEIGGLWILRKRYLLRRLLLLPFSLPVSVARAWKKLSDNDFTVINTTVVLNYIIASALLKASALIHVHEIPTGLAAKILPFLVRWSKLPVIFNSKATANAFDLPPTQTQYLVYNGSPLQPNPSPSSYDGSRPLRLCMPGRFNDWKGQDLLIKAVAAMPAYAADRLEVRILGGSFDGARFGDYIRRLVKNLNIQDIIKIEDFKSDMGEAYQWADAIVVPSRRPEPFGLVAIEAMSFGRPVLAAGHGGLTEIIVPGKTGWLFEPNSVANLSTHIERIISSSKEVVDFGNAARLDHAARFSAESSESSFLIAIDDVLRQARLPAV
jgi:glycosyltransferase involved in cell wall biosynthesis